MGQNLNPVAFSSLKNATQLKPDDPNIKLGHVSVIITTCDDRSGFDQAISVAFDESAGNSENKRVDCTYYCRVAMTKIL